MYVAICLHVSSIYICMYVDAFQVPSALRSSMESKVVLPVGHGVQEGPKPARCP